MIRSTSEGDLRTMFLELLLRVLQGWVNKIRKTASRTRLVIRMEVLLVAKLGISLYVTSARNICVSAAFGSGSRQSE
jgi:hypothetical protein